MRGMGHSSANVSIAPSKKAASHQDTSQVEPRRGKEWKNNVTENPSPAPPP